MSLTAAPSTHRQVIIVVGNGMVGERFVLELDRHDLLDTYDVIVLGEEKRAAYDRVHLSAIVDGATADDLSVADVDLHNHHAVDVRLGVRAERIDTANQTLFTTAGDTLPYDHLVLATGSSPFVPPIPGNDIGGCHVYRTIEDIEGIVADATSLVARRESHRLGDGRLDQRGEATATNATTGVVVGGGLLGLEAANALRLLGVQTTVIEFAPRLMPRQLDQMGSDALRGHVEGLGLTVRTDTATKTIQAGADGRVASLDLGDEQIDSDIVVFSAGIRARDELARDAGLAVGERGGVLVGPDLTTSDPHIHAIGECAAVNGMTYGLVGPGYTMAKTLAARLAGTDATFDGADMSTKLKLLGVDVCSIGDAQGQTEDSRSVVFDDPIDGVYRRLVTTATGDRVLGAILVGDASGYDALLRLALSGRTPSTPAAQLIAPVGDTAPAATGDLHDDDLVCTCNSVTKGQLCGAIREQELTDIGQVKAATDAGSGCGSCTVLCQKILNTELADRGIEVDTSLCPHFPHTRQELYDIVAVKGHRTFAALLGDVGTGGGCEICKPAVASILATIHNEYVLDPAHAPLQDTNDRFLANIQKDGTYSVVPRVPGGEITPAKLKVIAEVAEDYDLYTKITGGQRIDLFGARLEQLPDIWERLIAAGFESGQAYGKSLRTVKSCVGQSWCRYGVQDSTTLAIAIEERYRGLRSPHKIKMAVSGCSRECAEAQSKDVGVIATENGWNLYVCGNGGMTPQHAVLLAQDVSTERLITLIDRFLAYYVRTADKLERTAPWLRRLDGGIDHVRSVVVDDSLGLAEELEAHMAHHVGTYADEWAATLADPARRSMFTSYVNDPAGDDLMYVTERGQRRPATAAERRSLPVVEVRPATNGVPA